MNPSASTNYAQERSGMDLWTKLAPGYEKSSVADALQVPFGSLFVPSQIRVAFCAKKMFFGSSSWQKPAQKDIQSVADVGGGEGTPGTTRGLPPLWPRPVV